MFNSVLRVTSGSLGDWKVTHVPVKEYHQEVVEQFQGGNLIGFAKLLYSRMVFPDLAGNFRVLEGLDNDKLGLPKEELDEFTKIAVNLAESGYFGNEGT
jgi:hypothetical protein